MKPETYNLLPFLKCIPLFADLSDSALTMIARVSHLKQLPKDQILFCQDDSADAAYIVRSGTIAIVLNTADGRQLVVNEIHPGDCFGELALLISAPRTASAIAIEPCELIVLPREPFLAEIMAEPSLMRHLIETLARRLRSSTEREGALAFLDAPVRLARILLQLDCASGSVATSQEELAQHIGITRQTAAKILGEWRRKGWIVTKRSKIVILDRVALKNVTRDK